MFWKRHSDSPGESLAKQSLRTEGEYQKHHAVDYEKLDLGRNVDSEGAGQTNQDGAGGGATDTAKTTNPVSYTHLDVYKRQH